MFDKKDMVHLKNLQRIIAKAKVELDGAEILAAADVIRWVGLLEKKVEESIKDKEAKELALRGEEKIEEPKSSDAPESLPEKPVRKSKKTE